MVSHDLVAVVVEAVLNDLLEAVLVGPNDDAGREEEVEVAAVVLLVLPHRIVLLDPIEEYPSLPGCRAIPRGNPRGETAATTAKRSSDCSGRPGRRWLGPKGGEGAGPLCLPIRGRGRRRGEILGGRRGRRWRREARSVWLMEEESCPPRQSVEGGDEGAVVGGRGGDGGTAATEMRSVVEKTACGG